MNGLKANERGGFDIAVGQVLYIPSKDKDVDMDKETEQSTNPGDDQNAVGDDEIPAGGRKKSAPAYIKPENRMLRTTTRFPHGRMQYRDDPAQEWIDLESADKERDTSRQPEPINVQQVSITDSKIVIKQYNSNYGTKSSDHPLYGWEVTIEHQNISELVLCEWEDPTWKQDARLLSICFKCTGPPSSSHDVSEVPTPDKQEELGWSDEYKKEMEVGLESTAGFPLAMFTKEPATLVGKYIRLAFLKGGKRRGTGVAWPQVIHNLMGQPFKYSMSQDAENKAPLNTYLEQKKRSGGLAVARFHKVTAGDRIEWSLVKKTPNAPQPSFAAQPIEPAPPTQSTEVVLPIRDSHPEATVEKKRAREEDPIENMSLEDLESLLPQVRDEAQRDATEAARMERILKEAKKKAKLSQNRVLDVEDQIVRVKEQKKRG
ncbi:MAG: hypothetical protein Q9205_007437 [Flavoplaca limonia]